jgi:hypothetical protein
MNIPFLGSRIDERFLEHRRRSTSLAGIIGGLVAIGLWAYRWFADHVWNWDLFAVALTIALVKVALMIWYSTTD